MANSIAVSYIQMGCPDIIIAHPDEDFRDDARAEGLLLHVVRGVPQGAANFRFTPLARAAA